MISSQKKRRVVSKVGVRGDFNTMERGEGLAINFMYEVKG